MKIVFLGTNGWYDTGTGNTNCVLIDSEKFYIILDAGNGIYKIDQYIKKDKPIYMFIGHLHIDHIAGLHILPKFKFSQSLTIFVPKGMKKFLLRFVDKPYTAPLKDLPYKTDVLEIEEDYYEYPFSFISKKLFHADICYGFRFNIEGKIITYCLDTGPCDNSVKLATGTDVLIHECALKKVPLGYTWGHSDPKSAAETAKKAFAKKLILTHFSADSFLSMKERGNAEKEARNIFKNTFAAKDGFMFDL